VSGMRQDHMAFDRANTVRRIDDDGHLFVSPVVLSASDVCGYLGSEIPGFESLELQPDRVYQMWREPTSLAAAAASLNGKPVLLAHKPISADGHPREMTVGSVGGDTRFEAPNLVGSISVWDADAIDMIERGELPAVSAAYRYQPVMEPGTADGVRYDGKMIVESFNHLALVAEPRVKAAVIGDAALPTLTPSLTETIMRLNSRRALVASGALTAYLAPKLAMDAKVDLGPVLAGVTAKTWKAKRPDIVAGLAAATKGKLAQDATLDDVVLLLDRLDDGMAEGMDEFPDEDEDDKKKPAEDEAEEDDKEKPAEDEEGPAMKPEMKAAMDAAIGDAVAKAVKATEQSVVGRMNAIREAERAVRPYVGEIAVAMDSAEAVYRFALDKAGVDHKGLHPTALKPVLLAQPVPGSVKPKTTMAHDAAAAKSFAERFPGADRIRHA